jgi:flagellar basal-body rod protein FlgF
MDKLIYTAFQSINNALDNKAVRTQNLSSTNTPGFRADMSVGSAGSGYLEQFDTLYTRAFPVIDEKNGFISAPGQIRQTGQNHDLAIRGDGFFLAQQDGVSPFLTRRGDMQINNENILINAANETILGNDLNPIIVPPHRKMTISEDGNISIEPLNSPPGTIVQVGTIGLTLGGEEPLTKSTDGRIRTQNGGIPAADQQPRVAQGYIEESNVNMIDELVGSIEEQRRYEVNVKMIKSAEAIDQGGTSLMRMPS